MISLSGLRKESLVLCKLLLIGEGYPIYTLQRVIFRISEEVGGRVLNRVIQLSTKKKKQQNPERAHLGDHECLNFSGVRDMRTNT